MRFWALVVSGLSYVLAFASPGLAASSRVVAIEPGDRTFIKLKLGGMDPPAAKDLDRDDRLALAQVYGCGFAPPAWTDSSGYTATAHKIIAELKRADDWGLSASDFAIPELPPNPTLPERAAAEEALSLAALKYARYARGGRIPEPSVQLASYLDRHPRLPDPVAVLANLAASPTPDAYLLSFQPQNPEFERLRQAYLAARRPPDPWMIRIPPGSVIRVGDTHQQIALLRVRLRTPAASGVDPNFYDDALAEKVRAVQREGGLHPGGTIGGRTRALLNDAISDDRDEDKARRLRANMEEWRWMPADLGAFHVEVNVPEFMVRVVKDGKVIHAERVVTGKTTTQTPIFSDAMKMVVFQPQWGLPDSIKINEVLPRLLAGNGLRSDLRMKRNGRDIDPDDVNWRKANILEYNVYQPSGDDNALGQVKFLFPNKHQVYMHDTPSKRLFGERERTFSHGCVRVRNPVKLAEIVMAEDQGWPAKKVVQLTNDGPENNKVGLSREIPVHIMYFTAHSDEAGKIEFFRDVYGHENRIALALEGRWKDIPRLPDHLAVPSLPNVKPGARQARGGGDDEDEPRPQRRRRQRAAVDEPPSPPVRRAAPVRYAAEPRAATRYIKSAPQANQNIFQKIFGSN